MQQAAIHWWDAQLACGVIQSLEPDTELDGIDDFLLVERGSMTLPLTHRFDVRWSDSDSEWTVGDASLVAESISGTEPDVLFVLHGRKRLEDISVDDDATEVQTWLNSMDLD